MYDKRDDKTGGSTGMAKGSRYDQQFKENAVRYRLEHPELSLQKAAENLGISDSALQDVATSGQRERRERTNTGIRELFQ